MRLLKNEKVILLAAYLLLLTILLTCAASCRVVHSVFSGKRSRVDSASIAEAYSKTRVKGEASTITLKRDTSLSTRDHQYTRRIVLTTYPPQEGLLFIGAEAQAFWDSLHRFADNPVDPKSLGTRWAPGSSLVVTIDETGLISDFKTEGSESSTTQQSRKDSLSERKEKVEKKLESFEKTIDKEKKIKATHWGLYTLIGVVILLAAAFAYFKGKSLPFSFFKRLNS